MSTSPVCLPLPERKDRPRLDEGKGMMGRADADSGSHRQKDGEAWIARFLFDKWYNASIF